MTNKELFVVGSTLKNMGKLDTSWKLENDYELKILNVKNSNKEKIGEVIVYKERELNNWFKSEMNTAINATYGIEIDPKKVVLNMGFVEIKDWFVKVNLREV